MDEDGQVYRCPEARVTTRQKKITETTSRMQARNWSEAKIKEYFAGESEDALKDPVADEVPITLGDEVERAVILMESAKKSVETVRGRLFNHQM